MSLSEDNVCVPFVEPTKESFDDAKEEKRSRNSKKGR
jgi:hypothetical protein